MLSQVILNRNWGKEQQRFQSGVLILAAGRSKLWVRAWGLWCGLHGSRELEREAADHFTRWKDLESKVNRGNDQLYPLRQARI